MTWFVERALERMPIPASIWDTSFAFVAENRSCRRLNEMVHGKVDRTEIAERTGLRVHLEYATQSPAGRWHMQVPPAGWWTISTLRTERWQARPDLLMATLHLGVDSKQAEDDHERLRLLLSVLEASEKAIQVIESATTMLESAAAGLEAMEAHVSRTVGRDTYDQIENLPPGVLTALRDLAEG